MSANKIVYHDLSYRLVGLMFKVYNNLGYGLQEKYYQRAFREELEKTGLIYQRELSCPINYNGKNIGRYYLDFLIENKIVIELKVARDFYARHLKQVLSYLKKTKLKLGIVAIFTSEGLKYKRVLNIRKDLYKPIRNDSRS